ncbi:MAG TPA: hypothetical protein VHR86_10365, partial [Armatimonadota bacterium]|nr:hypothetical protein [Armatimonadota bacterium]
GAIVMEMIGYSVDGPNPPRVPIRIPIVFWPSSTGNSIVDVGNSQSAFVGRRYERAARRYAPDLEVYSLKYLGGFLKDGARSDHSSYWACDLPAIMLTDTANFRNTNYHKPSDQVSTVNFKFMTGVTRATAGALLEWAEFESAAPASTLTFYRESCKQAARPLEIDNPAKGLSLHDLSREAACREIITRYWNAVSAGDEQLAAKLWCAWPNGGHPRLIKENRLVEVGKPYQQKGCFDGIPNLITPIRVQLADGRIVEEKLIVIFRDVGLEESCLIIGVYNR